MAGVIVKVAPDALDALSPDRRWFAASCHFPEVEFGSARIFGVKSFVYVIQPEGHAACKIGVAELLQGRLAELQCGAWAKLRCMAAIAVVDGNAIKLEQATHRLLKRRGHHLIGEWFDISYETAAQAVVAVADERGDLVESLEGIRKAERERHAITVAEAEAERLRVLRRKLGMD